MSKSLFSVTQDPFTGGGIFTAMQTLNPPWASEDIAAQLDLIYYGNVSGFKLVSPLVERLMTGSKLSAVETATLAGALMATNGNRWAREWATRSAQYDPIENYRMTEELTDDETVTEYGRRDTRTDNLQHGETRTDNLQHSETRTDNLQHSETRTDNLQHSETRTDNLQHSETRTDNLTHSETRTDNLTHRKTGTETLTPDVTVTENNDVYGFNSSGAVHDTKRTQSSDGTSDIAYDLTETDIGTVGTQGTDTGTVGTQGSNTGTVGTQGSNTGTVGTQGSNTGTQGISGSDTGTQSTQGTDTGTQTNVASGSDTSTRNYQLTRSGNIGVTTSQQMLTSERELWMWSFFYDVVFPDVDTVLTIPIYADSDDADGTGGGIIPTGTIAIIANGRHNVASYEYADVNVPNTYTESDEGKVVSDGALVAQTARVSEITANGTYDTTLNDEVTVHVPIGVDVLRGETDPAPQVGNNGDIYLKFTRPFIYDSELDFSCDSAYYVDTTSQKLCTQSTAFYKTVAGGCIAVYFHGGGYYGPILLSTVQDYVKYTNNNTPAANRYVTVNGVNWYYSTTDYWNMVKDANAAIPLFESVTNNIDTDVPYILDAALYHSGDLSDYEIVVDAYIKDNGSWDELIGKILHD